MLQGWLKLACRLECCASRWHISVAKKKKRSLSRVLSRHLSAAPDPPPGPWPSVTSLISYSVRRPGLAVWPRDINMQLVVDNKAKPHNQQIINSHRTPPSPPCLTSPSTHGSTCGKKVSCMLQYIRPPPCCEAVIDYSIGERRHCTPSHRIIFRGANGNMPGPLKIWLVCQECWMRTIPANRSGEENRCRPSIHQRSGSMEKLIHRNGVLSHT